MHSLGETSGERRPGEAFGFGDADSVCGVVLRPPHERRAIVTYAHTSSRGFELRDTRHVGKTGTDRERVQRRDRPALPCFFWHVLLRMEGSGLCHLPSIINVR